MRKPIIAGNWKMYKTGRETSDFAAEFKPLVSNAGHCEIVLCPPFVSIAALIEATQGSAIEVGGQNLFWAKEGAFTGEVSGPMLSAAGCIWVIIAHSERRQYFGETDESANRKAIAAIEAGLKPIFCVGEKLEEREAGRTEAVLAQQFKGLAPLTPEHFAQVTLAYEPVWAIGTGRTATPQIAEAAHRFLRELVRTQFGAEAADACRILYGGSVKPDNIRQLMAEPDIDGALVGGASLDANSFAAIVNYNSAS